ncbi:MAG: anti-sigma factor [Caldibacillus debilis]|jgi:anti-sigma-K factor RskA|uniref:Anti-sigma-W factor RsiW n=1 Tax=Caldibacillus debilis GB1 TaxID=1339248 RepID=A0A420VH30_9BACI|nr:anti-sigma factor [Caldibacillus debilis]REJ17309.1 MAG: anti-sigma factor [Caldibacillus debilis]RKO62951.1 putative zinc-finger/Anti-sigma-K factor rskA [Caldibacillus debilis GB1]
MKSNHVPETKMVEWILGTLPEKEREAMAGHLDRCAECRELLNSWRGLGIEKTAEYRRPSPAHKERIWMKAEKRKSKTFRPIFGLTAGLASLTVIAAVFSKLTFDSPRESDHYQIVQNEEVPVQRIIHNPNTKRFPIQPLSDFEDMNGMIWLNDTTREMLMEINGLDVFSTRDYQLWIIYTNDEIKGELLTIDNGSSRIFIKGEDVKDFKLIKASLEPKGGSRKPTGPETFIVHLKEE